MIDESHRVNGKMWCEHMTRTKRELLRGLKERTYMVRGQLKLYDESDQQLDLEVIAYLETVCNSNGNGETKTSNAA